MSKTSKILLVIGGLVFVLLVVGIIAVAFIAARMSGPEVADKSVLVLSVSGGLPDYVPEDPIAKAFGIKSEQSFT